MTTQSNILNLSDVTPVDPRTLALAMQYMVGTGRGLAMLRGICEAELREVDRALWDALGDNPAERVAALVRFRCLIKVFSSRRLRQLLMRTGFNLIAPAVQVAARMRLNADLGFNLVKFERSLVELLGKSDYESALAA
jgi:L-alanine-DL-glutamate epimerase-like enolase superfamily enzyme